VSLIIPDWDYPVVCTQDFQARYSTNHAELAKVLTLRIIREDIESNGLEGSTAVCHLLDVQNYFQAQKPILLDAKGGRMLEIFAFRVFMGRVKYVRRKLWDPWQHKALRAEELATMFDLLGWQGTLDVLEAKENDVI
jgi:hypothetical protein